MESRGSRIEMKQRSWRVEVACSGRRGKIVMPALAPRTVGRGACHVARVACHVALACHATTSRWGCSAQLLIPRTLPGRCQLSAGWHARSNWQLNFSHPGLDHAEAALHRDCRDFRWWVRSCVFVTCDSCYSRGTSTMRRCMKGIRYLYICRRPSSSELISTILLSIHLS